MWKALAMIILVQYISIVKCKNQYVQKHNAFGESDRFLKIGKIGYAPWHFDKNGIIKGSDMKLLEIISAKLNFSYSLEIATTGDDIVRMVIQMEWLTHTYITYWVCCHFQTANGTFDVGFGQFIALNWRFGFYWSHLRQAIYISLLSDWLTDPDWLIKCKRCLMLQDRGSGIW